MTIDFHITAGLGFHIGVDNSGIQICFMIFVIRIY
jgi:hypothetical protein